MTLKIPFWVVAIIAVVVFAFIFFHGCNKSRTESGTGPDTVYKETILKFDSTIHHVHHHHIHYKPAANFDTSQFIGLLPEGHIPGQPVSFTDSISDSLISGTYSGVIWENTLFNPEFKYKILRPQTIINNTLVKPDPNRSLSLGAFLGYSDAPILGGMAVYRDRRDRSFLVGYGLNQTMILGVSGKITLRRR